MLRLNEIIYHVSSVIWIKKKRKKLFFLFLKHRQNDWLLNQSYSRRKINFEIEFDNHFHAFVLISTSSINWCRLILFNALNSESKHIKHRVNLVNFDSQRSKTSLRITLSFWFLWFFKSFDHELHEKCHRFATSFKVTIIQKNDERFKSKSVKIDS
jgi:hypothetical protein